MFFFFYTNLQSFLHKQQVTEFPAFHVFQNW